MDFIAIDFETATSDRDSPCEIGLTFVKDNKVVDTKSWLIKPKQFPDFNPFNIEIHGIHPNDVADKPEFNELWNSEIKALLENQFVVAHNAGFDFSVLRRTLDSYKIPFPSLQYACSYMLAKKVWEGLLYYDLKSLCKYHNISTEHHRAGSDSLSCAELSIKVFENAEVNTIVELSEKLRFSIGQLYDGGYRPSETKKIYKPHYLSQIVGNPAKHNPESIFYGRSVIFTGTLLSMVRGNAQQIIADIGGINSNTVTMETDYLIVGQQDFRVVGEDGMSGKQEKAEKLLKKGAGIEVISESEFLRNI